MAKAPNLLQVSNGPVRFSSGFGVYSALVSIQKNLEIILDQTQIVFKNLEDNWIHVLAHDARVEPKSHSGVLHDLLEEFLAALSNVNPVLFVLEIFNSQVEFFLQLLVSLLRLTEFNHLVSPVDEQPVQIHQQQDWRISLPKEVF